MLFLGGWDGITLPNFWLKCKGVIAPKWDFLNGADILSGLPSLKDPLLPAPLQLCLVYKNNGTPNSLKRSCISATEI